MAQRPAVPPGSRRGAFIASPRTQYGFARGEPVPSEPALGNRSAARMAKLGFQRASGGQDARSERPARWHGLTPSFKGCDRGIGGLVANGGSGVRGPGWPNGPPSRPGGISSHQGSLGRASVWGGLVANGGSGVRGPGWPNGPPSRPGGISSHQGSLGRASVWGGLVVNGCSGVRGPGWPNGPPSRPARAGGLLCAPTDGIRAHLGLHSSQRSLASSASMAATKSASSGETRVLNRPAIVPSLAIRNFSKFQPISPLGSASVVSTS
jgi:hypothetical protein